MPSKPPGGRGKRESYTSSVVRVPDPLKSQVLGLIEDFHQTRPTDSPKPVTGLFQQIHASLVVELIDAGHPPEWNGETFFLYCDFEWKWWNKKFDKRWDRESRPFVERFNCLADKMNYCIWQVDNTFALADPDNIRDAVKRLVEYGLVTMDNPTPPATATQVAERIINSAWLPTDIKYFVWEAFQDKRFDILAALEVGKQPPVNRSQYWHSKYEKQLGKPGVDYWGWRGNPESKEICSELTDLLNLPRPHQDASKVLECLAEGKDPFFKPEINARTETEIFASVWKNIGKSGALADHKPEQKQAYRRAFIEWHLASLAQLGQDTLERIYKVVYGCDWNSIETILNPVSGEWWEVLGVPHNALAKEVKAAYRSLAKVWHPDAKPSSPLANERMIRINQALEEFDKTCYKFC